MASLKRKDGGKWIFLFYEGVSIWVRLCFAQIKLNQNACICTYIRTGNIEGEREREREREHVKHNKKEKKGAGDN